MSQVQGRLAGNRRAVRAWRRAWRPGPPSSDRDAARRWFVGLGVDDPAGDATTFIKNRDRLLEGAIAHRFLAAVLAIPRVKRLLSSEHFSVDGTQIEAWGVD